MIRRMRAVTGRSLDEALDLIEHFRQMMHGAEPGDEERLGDAIALEGVAKYPVRGEVRPARVDGGQGRDPDLQRQRRG